MARKSKFDYDSRKFYQTIYSLAFSGCTDKEITEHLSEEIGVSLTASTFSKMKNGKYHRWSETQNHRRGDAIRIALTKGRRHLTPIIRRAYLDAALGGKMVKSETKITTQLTFADGTTAESMDIERINTEREQPPNVRALDRILQLLDPEWRSSSQKIKAESKDSSIDVEKLRLE